MHRDISQNFYDSLKEEKSESQCALDLYNNVMIIEIATDMHNYHSSTTAEIEKVLIIVIVPCTV